MQTQSLFMNSETSTGSSFSTVSGHGGASLVSILICLGGVIGVLVVTGVILLHPPCGKSTSGMITSDFKSMENALERYKLVSGRYPSTTQSLKALVEKPSNEPV